MSLSLDTLTYSFVPYAIFLPLKIVGIVYDENITSFCLTTSSYTEYI